MKRWITALCCAFLLMGALAQAEEGAFTGTATGYRGPVSVEVTLADGKISALTVTEQQETPGVGGRALAVLPERVLEAQTIAIDSLSGATITSAAFKAAVKNALTDAGALKAFSGPVAEAAHREETLEYDVVVAGSGVAGSSAALAAAQAGARVLLLEKVSIIGGTTNVSGGAVMGTMSYMNEERGDESEELAQWWYQRGEEKVNYDQLLWVTQQSGRNVNWLIDLGWDPVLGTGGDSVKEWSHRPNDGNGNRLANGGFTIINVLSRAFAELGGVTMVDTPLTQLLTDEDGAVIGCIAESKDTTYTIRAKGGVILATGGFENDPEMKAIYAYNSPETHNLGGNAGDTGDAIKLTLPLGADIVYLGYTMPAWNSPANVSRYGANVAGIRAEGRAIELNGRMERFVNELATQEMEKWYMATQRGSTFYVLLDANQDEETLAAFEKAVEGKALYKADTLAELAAQVGGDGEALEATLKRWNELAAAGEDTDFGNVNIQPLSETGPYYLSYIYEGNTGTYGGPKVNLDAEIVRTDGSIIPGLYAAGECANGEFYYRDYICGGSSLAMGIAFGREAGNNAAARAAE